MKYPRCQYYQQLWIGAKRVCNAPKNAHTFDEGCKGHRSSCPAYVNDEMVWRKRNGQPIQGDTF